MKTWTVTITAQSNLARDIHWAIDAANESLEKRGGKITRATVKAKVPR